MGEHGAGVEWVDVERAIEVVRERVSVRGWPGYARLVVRRRDDTEHGLARMTWPDRPVDEEEVPGALEEALGELEAWALDQAGAVLEPGLQTRFRLRVMAAGGEQEIAAPTFYGELSAELEAPAVARYELPEPIGTPSSRVTRLDIREADLRAATPALAAVGALYARAIADVDRQLVAIAAAHERAAAPLLRIVEHLQHELAAEREAREMLVGKVVEMRAAELDRREQSIQSRETAEVTADAVDRVAEKVLDTGKQIYLAHQGLSPELAEVLEVMADEPDFSAALRDPAVRTLMRDRETVREVAAGLRQMARLRAQEEAKNAATDT